MLVVLDVNVIVSAVITPTGVARSIVQAGIEGRFDYVACPALLEELADVLARPKISRLVPSDAADRFIADVRGRARLEPDPTEPSQVSRDPDDEYLVALAVSVSADGTRDGRCRPLDVSDPPGCGLGSGGVSRRCGRFRVSGRVTHTRR